MGKTVAYIGCILMVLLTAALATIFFIEHGSKPEPALVAESSVPIGDYQYVLRDYGGKLAVFEADSVTPDIVFDVYIKIICYNKIKYDNIFSIYGLSLIMKEGVLYEIY